MNQHKKRWIRTLCVLLALVFCFTSGLTVGVFAEGLESPSEPETVSQEPSTEPPTAPSVEPSSEETTEAPTETSLEPSTESPTEPVTEPTTEPETEPTTSTEDVNGKNPVRVMGCSISDGAVLKSLNVITITFSNNVVNASVAENNRSKIRILDAGGGRVPSVVSMADDQVQADLRRIITISPISALEDGNYRLVVKAGVMAKNGTSTASDYVVHFTIRGSQETEAATEPETDAPTEPETGEPDSLPADESLEDHGGSGNGSSGTGDDSSGDGGNGSGSGTVNPPAEESAEQPKESGEESQASDPFDGFAANQVPEDSSDDIPDYENLTPEMLALASITTPKEKESETEESSQEETKESQEEPVKQDTDDSDGEKEQKAPVLQVYQLTLNSAPGHLIEWKEESFDFMLARVKSSGESGDALGRYVILSGIVLVGIGAGARYLYFRKQLKNKQEKKK